MWEVSVNVGLGEGKVGSFPETYNGCPTTLPLSQHFALSEKEVLVLA